MINNSIVSVITLIGTAVFAVCYFYRRSRKISWRPIGTVGDLLIYPLKSGRRVSVESALCTQFGLEAAMLKDRCLVVYNEETKAFQTARNFPRLLMIETKTNDDSFTLIGPGGARLRIAVPTLRKNREDYVVMWNGEKVFTIDCGDEAARWISKILLGHGYGLRLGYHDGSRKRDIRKFHSRYIDIYPRLKRATSGKYSDLSTILLLTDSSVNDVISRVPNVSKHNFRPNIVVGGANIEPYAEDNWDRIKIGDAVLKSVMPCPRCSITTIDPESGLHNEGFEPIATMRTYRKLTKYQSGLSYPNLGVYMSVEHPGRICVDDVVYISD